MKRSVNEYDENRGGGYATPKNLSKNMDQEELDYIAGGLGLAGAATTAAMSMGPKRTNEDILEAAETAKTKREAVKRESDAEIKRESRGVKKPANFDAIEESKRDAKDSATAKKQDKAYNESLTTENKRMGGMTKMAGGGMTASKRADGCATKGKTRGKMV